MSFKSMYTSPFPLFGNMPQSTTLHIFPWKSEIKSQTDPHSPGICFGVASFLNGRRIRVDDFGVCWFCWDTTLAAWLYPGWFFFRKRWEPTNQRRLKPSKRETHVFLPQKGIVLDSRVQVDTSSRLRKKHQNQDVQVLDFGWTSKHLKLCCNIDALMSLWP